MIISMLWRSVQLFFELFGPIHPIEGMEKPCLLVVVEKRGGALVVIGEADLKLSSLSSFR
jgi:hypothetical protein